MGDCEICALLQMIKARKVDFSNVVFAAISRSFNGRADNLAKSCLNIGNAVLFINSNVSLQESI